MRAAALCLALAYCASSFAQDHFKFVVTGDGRWDTHGTRPGDKDGVNVAGMTRLVKAIVAEGPAVLLFPGDTVGGAKTDEAQASQFRTWIGVMQPAYDAGIHVLVGRGNHELHCQHPDDVWRDAFSGAYANPDGGPAGEEGMTYAFTYGNSIFLSLDQFKTDKCAINQPWLDSILANSRAAHIFPFGHKMAFRVARHTDGMEEAPEEREKFMGSLVKAGGRTFFCGHDHLYDHTVLTKPGWSADREIHQFVVGTAGAPFYHGIDRQGANRDWNLKNVAHVEDRLGYCLVEVDGPKVTITFKGETSPGVFESADQFTFSVAQRR